jgi:maltose O-acetyltransferase
MDEATERQKMIRGELYRASDPELTAERVRARRTMAAYSALDPGAVGDRRELLAGLLAAVGDDVVVEAPLHCDYGWNISLGAAVYINANCVILDCAPVSIGDSSMLGPGVQLCTATHPVDPAARLRGLEYALPITIGRNVWIGASVVVGPGVTVGDDAVIGAGSVVVKDVPPGVVVAGNPARIVRRLR